MPTTVCLFANTLGYPEGGGHFWVYLNWALGLRSCGCDVIWLESSSRVGFPDKLRRLLIDLKARLKPYGLGDAIALSQPVSTQLQGISLVSVDVVRQADLLLDLSYCDSADITASFRRSAMVDIDPGQTQVWISSGVLRIAPHDLYFTIGETVGTPEAHFSDCGLRWIYTPPCVSLEWWIPCDAPSFAPYSTVSQWYGRDAWFVEGERCYENSKRAGFLPFVDVPQHVNVSLELALSLDGDDVPISFLNERGWSVREATEVSSTPWDYQTYIQVSRGEFSCVKPACVSLQNAWISDRTLCYLASGKPAVVQHTGSSRFLPDAHGLFRFQTFEQAIYCLDEVESDYMRHSNAARSLAEELFDAKKVVARVLEYSL